MIRPKTFSKIDTLTGWLAFAIAAVTYCLTTEPSASLWDCPEFVASGYKLEIGHPPGAPFFMLCANLFAQMADDPSEVARMTNMMSALLSAGCILFLFWTITHLTRRLTQKGDSPTLAQVILIEASGLTGALAYAFSDTFWFSAVESEVYAFSSFLTALVFWLILKWEEEADEPRSDRWIILIAYIIGLSIGVHLLNLLCIPAMALVVYYRKTKQATWWGGVKALTAGGLVLLGILYGIVPGVIRLGGWAELLFVNVLGLPFHTGLITAFLLLLTMVIIFISRTQKRVVKSALLSLLMLLVGFSCYGVILIRSSAQPPMDENSPDNVFGLGSYLSREQYGDAPLLHGPAYCSELDYEPMGEYQVAKQEEGAPVYRLTNDSTGRKYTTITHRIKYVYKDNMWFPRMVSPQHAQAYEQWMGGVEKKGNLPTTRENIRFFLSYQVYFMYWRYFLWNFVGRENNIKSDGEVEHGQWITGIRFIDNLLLDSDTSKLPSDLLANKGRNVFYGLPLLLGMLGLWWQYRQGSHGRRQSMVVGMLFLMTGLAIVVYLNQTPQPPRERDYVYAGSFYAFAIWIGMGASAMASLLQRIAKRPLTAAIAASVLSMLVPLQMVSQTWDDHDRSGRFACRDFGLNYLESMPREGHPIILTNGDNDTFPLWYNHEVEGKRTDTRDCNLSYVNTDWYIDQMKRPAYDSPPLPFDWKPSDYQEGKNDLVAVRPELKESVLDMYREQPEEARKAFGDHPFELSNIIRHWVLADTPERHCIPTDSVTITTGESQMQISLKGIRYLQKNDLFVLEMLSHGDWERPIYASISLGDSEIPYLHDHYVLEGLAYRITPESNGPRVDVERLYENVMHRFKYGGLHQEGIYVDEDVMHMARTHQYVMSILIDSLLSRGDKQRALAVAEKWEKELPACNIPLTEPAISLARCYYENGMASRGDDILTDLLVRSDEWLSWIETIGTRRRPASLYTAITWLKTMQHSLETAYHYEREPLTRKYHQIFERHANQYQKG
ncbi:MAG: DUF2723 domain-containing protein [Prevotella sp.]|nr:DUF2723 domain-containing protein [Prevotella sp.]